MVVDIKKITEMLRDFYQENHRGPSYRELADMAGYASKQAAYRLAKKLIDAGILERDATGRLSPRGPRLGLPVLGFVQAGFPTPAEEELIDTISLDEFLIRKPESSFLLRVSGDSMIDAGIQPGDLVVIERISGEPRNGRIVLAEVDGDWTLKYYRRVGDRVKLIPANNKYPEIEACHELKIGGVVASVMRRYEEGRTKC